MGEGPIWHNAHGCWYFVYLPCDFKTYKAIGTYINRVTPEGEVTQFNIIPSPNKIPNRMGAEEVMVDVEGWVQCIAETTDPNVLIGGYGDAGFCKFTLDFETMNIEVEQLFNPMLHEEFGGGPHGDSKLNDGKVSPDGKFFCPSYGGGVKGPTLKQYFWNMDGNNELAPLLYRYDEVNNSAIVQEDVGHFCTGNGPNWSPDGTKYYQACTGQGVVREYDYDIETSTVVGPGKTIFNTKDLPGASCFIDGGTIDAQGTLWYAGFQSKKLFRIDPTEGKLIREYKLKVDCPMSCAFGGPDFKTLLVVSMGATKAAPNGDVMLINFEDDSI